ncbi:hypothetical protein TrCOL_g4406 [Triparma columacea]|uniref:F-box domain-containing protein n=1 Tax=Triparma columacea TaxID=722753 RepID=A0A9W7GNJ4_9STRA|nr:hypothetical protein TrCOL_g4406 [Triparma columacea]
MLIHIFHYLPVPSVVRCREVNRSFKEVATSGNIWQDVYMKRFPSALVPALVPSHLWYACYASMVSACSEVKERSLMDMRYSRCKFGVCDVVGCLWVGKGKDMNVHCRDVHGMGG